MLKNKESDCEWTELVILMEQYFFLSNNFEI